MAKRLSILSGIVLLSCVCWASASPAHAQRERRSTDGWSECSATCGGGVRSKVESSIDCNVFGCNFSPSCTCGKADIVFIVDHSGSIGEDNYWRQKQFMLDVVTGLERVGDSDTRDSRVAVVSFGNAETVEFDFNDGYSIGTLSHLRDQIWSMPYRDGNTNTASGLKAAADIFNSQGRVGPKRIAILLADGASTWYKNLTIPRSDELKNTGAFLYAIGIGNVDEDEMKGIASDPDDLFYFSVSSYGRLDEIIEEVLNGSCCYSTETTCVTSGVGVCSAPCDGGVRTSVETCTYTNYFGDVIKVIETPTTEACCTGSCTEASTAPSVADCAKCDYTYGVGYLPDPSSCNCYYQCQPAWDSYLIHHMCCAPGLYWSSAIKNCDWPANVGCGVGRKRRQAGDEECQAPAAPAGTTTSTAAPGHYPCPYTRDPANPSHFLYNGLFMGVCPPGLTWNVVDCACTGVGDVAECDDDILLHFPFDNHLDDVSCNKAKSDNHGNVELKSTSGRTGGAAYFTGSNFLSVEFLNNWFARQDVQAWTMALWVKPTGGSASGFAGLVNNGDCEDAPSVSVFQASGGSASAGIHTATSSLLRLANHGVSQNQWQHVAMVYSGWQLTFFKNGQRQPTSISVSGSIQNRHCPLNIGRESLSGTTSAGYFTGYMDEIRVYNRALGDWDIQQLYNNP